MVVVRFCWRPRSTFPDLNVYCEHDLIMVDGDGNGNGMLVLVYPLERLESSINKMDIEFCDLLSTYFQSPRSLRL